MSHRPARPRHDDSGFALLLAIGFVLMIGAISASLVAVANTSVESRATLESVRNREYAADGAVEQAIAQARALTCTPASESGFVLDSSVNGVAIRVDWQKTCGHVLGSDGTTMYPQRNVLFLACPDVGMSCTSSDAIVTAQVNFDPAGGSTTKTFVQSWSVNR